MVGREAVESLSSHLQQLLEYPLKPILVRWVLLLVDAICGKRLGNPGANEQLLTKTRLKAV